MDDEPLRFEESKELNEQIRHWERLLFDNARTTIVAMVGAISAAGLVAVLGGGVTAGRAAYLAAALLSLAALLGLLGSWQASSTRKYLLGFYGRRGDLTVGWKPTHGSGMTVPLLIAVLALVSYLCVAGAVALLYLQQGQPGGAAQTNPTAVTLQGLDELTRAVDRLADRLPAALPPPPAASGAASAVTEWLPLRLRDERSEWGVAHTLAAVSVGLAALGLVVAWLAPWALPRKMVLATGSLALAIGGTLPLSFKGEVNLKADFSCGPGGCLRIERGSPGHLLTAREATPSFDVGSAERAAKRHVCIKSPQDNDAAWGAWLEGFKKEWLARPNPSAHDLVLLSGSADRQALSPALRSRHESNAGLALARAEHVAGLLLQQLGGAEQAAPHRLDARRILVMAAGPAGTGAPPAAAASGVAACADPALAAQRRVSVWWQRVRG